MLWFKKSSPVEWADDSTLQTVAQRLADRFHLPPFQRAGEHQLMLLRCLEVRVWAYLCYGTLQMPFPKSNSESMKKRRSLAKSLQRTVTQRAESLGDLSEPLIRAAPGDVCHELERLLSLLLSCKGLDIDNLKALIHAQSHGFGYGAHSQTEHSHICVAYSQFVPVNSTVVFHELADDFIVRGLLPDPAADYEGSKVWIESEKFASPPDV